MEIHKREKDNFIIFYLEGDLKMGNIAMFEQDIFPYIKDDEKKVVVDMENVPYMDSSGLGAFVKLNKRLHEYKKEIIIIGVNEKVMNIFKVSKLNTIFNIYNCLEDIPSN